MAWTTPSTWASGDWNIQIRDNMNYMFSNLPPIGSVIPFAGRDVMLPDISTGWIPCDGRTLSTIGTYADLHEVIGYNYGGSGGSFLIPNTNGRAVFGVGDATNAGGNNINAIVNASGDSGGTNHGSHGHGMMNPTNGTSNATVSSATQFAGGTHDHNFVTSAINHDHNFVDSGNVGRASSTVNNAAAPSHGHNFVSHNSSHGHTFAAHPGHEHSVASSISGGSTADSSQAVDMRPPFIGMYYIIRYV